jgi:hypothetical protein
MQDDEVYELCRLMMKPYKNVEEQARIEELAAKYNQIQEEKAFRKQLDGIVTREFVLDMNDPQWFA